MKKKHATASGGILKKDFIKKSGKVIPKGTFYQCDQATFREMDKEGYFDGRTTKKSKGKVKQIKIEKDA